MNGISAEVGGGQELMVRKMDNDVCDTQWEKLGAWFIGPTAENLDEFCDLAIESIRQNVKPQNYFSNDREMITNEVKSSTTYKKEMAKLKLELKGLNVALTESIPYSSVRYQGHMVSETTLPAKLGYLAAWMTNANNAASELGPVTTRLEIEVGKQLCEMIGFESTCHPWGHITNGGSTANLEALWASRNIKFFPLAIQKAIKDERVLASARDLSVYIPRLGRKQKITTTSTWDLLNLDLDDIVELPHNIQRQTGKDAAVLKDVLNKYTLANDGFVQFYLLHGLRTAPIIIASAANHFSWGKAATLVGVGGRNLVCVPFDRNARMDIVALRKLLDEKLAKKVPVIAVICVFGTTEHGAVDPISDVLKLRTEYRNKGLNFYILADGAWGGYFATLIRQSQGDDQPLPPFPISDYIHEQLTKLKYVDTVTIDPHKSGYCPYPAGGLCYRNGHMKSFISFATDMVFMDADTVSNCNGVEASKPGAGPAGVYLTHKVIGLHSSGYGRILGQSMLGAKLFYCAWMTAANSDDNFVCVPLTPIPEDFDYDEESAKTFIRDRILSSSYKDLVTDAEVMRFLSEIGPDVAINAFAVNTKGNTSVNKCNRLNMAVFEKLSQSDPRRKTIRDIPLFLTKSRLAQKECFRILKSFKTRLGVSANSSGVLTFLRNTVTNPWTSADNTIQMLVQQFRKVVIQCIAEIDETENKAGEQTY
ncbi:L-tyrosine decarboxylase-like [Ylistrum balloti]|uniref:L-tyrosine decarboxylase-like n=1 Tax=Ylistrum balloti TaxID=509963 RepID=UPI002905DAA9|nr:L-tyrosine decarboxylase-like [Ylistrum balloti]